MNKKALALALLVLSSVVTSVEARKSQPWYKSALQFVGWKDKEVKSVFDAVNADDLEAAFRVIRQGAKVNEVGRGKATPLHEAAKIGNPEMVRFLTARGAQVNAVDAKGMTPLHEAAAKGHDDVVKILLAKGARVNARNEKGDTALHLAAKQSCYSMTVAALIKGGANVNLKNKKGRTALQVATKGNCATRHNILAQNPKEVKKEAVKKAVVAKAVAHVRAQDTIKKGVCTKIVTPKATKTK